MPSIGKDKAKFDDPPPESRDSIRNQNNVLKDKLNDLEKAHNKIIQYAINSRKSPEPPQAAPVINSP